MMRAFVAAAIAGSVALLLAVPEIRGVATWKWVLGAIGLVLFLSGRGRRPGGGS